MESNAIHDPYFITCGMNGQIYAVDEWFQSSGIDVRQARFAISSSLVLIGGPADDSQSVFDPVMGWLIKISGDLGGDTAKRVTNLLNRLGVAANQTLIVAWPENWTVATEVWTTRPGANIIYLALPSGEESEEFPGQLELKNQLSRTVLQVANRQELRKCATFLLPDNYRSSVQNISLAYYDSTRISPEIADGYRYLYLAFAGALSALTGNGSVADYLFGTLGSGHNPPSAQWIAAESGGNEAIRASRVKLSLSAKGLYVAGFDALQSKAATGWGSRVHTLKMIGVRTGVTKVVKLGALKREIVNTLPAGFSFLEQTYAAFTLPQHQSLDLKGLASDTFVLEVLDESGFNLLARESNVLIGSDHFSDGIQECSIYFDEGHWLLDIMAPL